MRLSFNVLWIDNQPDQIRSTQERVDIAIKKEGFRLNTIDVLSYEDSRDHLDPDGHVLRDEIDLVVVDWDLGNDKIKGDEAIVEIRGQVPYKDLVLYSAVAPGDLKDKVQAKAVQAVFTVHRNDLAETVIGLFQSLMKKVLDLDHSRGIVMAATSDIDQIVRDLLFVIETKLDSDQRDSICKYLKNELKVAHDDMGRVRGSFEADQNLVVLLSQHHIMGASRKLRLLRRMLNLLNYQDHGASVKSYFEKIPTKRDKLGHVRLIPSQSKVKLTGPDSLEVSEDELRALRIALLEHRDRFEDLARLFDIPF